MTTTSTIEAIKARLKAKQENGNLSQLNSISSGGSRGFGDALAKSVEINLQFHHHAPEDIRFLLGEVEHLNRQLADERSGDCDKDKTIRRLTGNCGKLNLRVAEIEAKKETLVEERDQLKAEVERMNKQCVPMFADKILELTEERDQLKAEVENLRAFGGAVAKGHWKVERDQLIKRVAELEDKLHDKEFHEGVLVLRAMNEGLANERDRLAAENERLREALQNIRQEFLIARTPDPSYMADQARKALEQK